MALVMTCSGYLQRFPKLLGEKKGREDAFAVGDWATCALMMGFKLSVE